MGLIINNIEIRGTNKALKMNALIDSGAEGNYISKILPNRLEPVQLGFVSYSEIPVSIPGSSSAEL
ncbi:MAG: hypothetical protein ACYDDC_08995, partial [Thermoplasmataceae archaeon]